MKHKIYSLPLKISQKCYVAFREIATNQNYFVAGLYRQFISDVLAKHGESTSGIPLPTERQLSKEAKEKVSCQLSAGFYSMAVINRVNMAHARLVAANPGNPLSRSRFLLGELREWLEGKGNVFTIEEMKGEKPPKKVKE